MSAYTAIHVAAKQLKIDEQDLRDVYERVTGLRSLKAMNDGQRRAIVEEMRRLGGFSFPSAKGKPLSGPYAKKAQALWIALWNLGVVDDKRDSALLAFFARQTGIERTEWVLDARDGKAVVEALKDWCRREGVDFPKSQADGHAGRIGHAIARAQYAKISERPYAEQGSPFWALVCMILRRSTVTTKPSDAEWITVMNDLGARVRGRTAVLRQAQDEGAEG